MKNMKWLALFFVTVVSFNACNTTEECNSDNYGSVSISNNLDEDFVFDVTYQKDENGDWIDNNKIKINIGDNYTWDKVSAGDIRVWIDLKNDKMQVLEDVNLSQCENKRISYQDQCNLFGTGEAIVKNETSLQLVVDIKTSEGYVQEVKLDPGEQVIYRIPPGDIEYWSNTENIDAWTVSEKIFTLEKCGESNYTWTDTKSATFKPTTKQHNTKQYLCD